MRLPPLKVFESWPAPNYVNPQTHGSANVIVTLVLFGLVCVILGLRMYTRLWISKNFGLDDWLILVTFIPTAAFTVTSLLIEEAWGWNRHVWDMPLYSISFGLKYVLVTEFLFSTAAAFTKLSMLALIYRIMGGSGRLGFLIKTTAAFIVALWIALGLALVFQCRPPSDYWKLTFDYQPNCVSEPILLLVGGILNTVTDLLVVLLPMPKVCALQLPVRETAIVVVLFGAGILVTVAGAVRTFFTYQIAETYDKTWVLYYVLISAGVELNVGITCACIPATKKFFSRYIPILLKPNSSTTSPSSSDPTHTFYALHTVAATLTPPDRRAAAAQIPEDVKHTHHDPPRQGQGHVAKTASFDTATTAFQSSDEQLCGGGRRGEEEEDGDENGVEGVGGFDFQFEYLDRKDAIG